MKIKTKVRTYLHSLTSIVAIFKCNLSEFISQCGFGFEQYAANNSKFLVQKFQLIGM